MKYKVERLLKASQVQELTGIGRHTLAKQLICAEAKGYLKLKMAGHSRAITESEYGSFLHFLEIDRPV